MALIDLLKFVTTGAWGSGLARPLTAAEGDGNIYALADGIQDVIDGAVAGVDLSNITVSSDQVTFYMSDGSTRGPFTLPSVRPRYRGAWEALTLYEIFDIVQVAGSGTYMIGVEHISDVTFVSTASNSEGDYYLQIAPSNTEKSFTVTTPTLALTTTYWNSFINCTYATGCAVTLPGFPDPETQITFRQGGEFPITFTHEFSEEIFGVLGYDLMTGGQGSVVTCKYVNGQWLLWGRLAPVSA